MAPFMPSAAGVRTRSAPSDRIIARRSRLMLSGMQSVRRYPRAAQTNASAMPVFPLVGSTTFMPGLRSPRFSASQIMFAPTRHFTEYAGLRPSILARTVASVWAASVLIRTSGVLPMASELSFRIGTGSRPAR